MNEDSKLNEQIDRRIRSFMNGPGFSARKLGDTPTDSLSLVPRKFVTGNGSVAGRPNSSVATVGQFFLNTSIPMPMWYTSAGWIDGVGSVVATA